VVVASALPRIAKSATAFLRTQIESNAACDTIQVQISKLGTCRVDIESQARDPLVILQDRISVCRLCESFAPDFAKPTSMYRGTGGKVMIVGQGPGKTEIQNGMAFSGQSGKRLDEWLRGCGFPADNPRADVYCTSITKCYTSDSSCVAKMAEKCAPFLQEQLQIVRPRIVITLGEKAYNALAIDDTPSKDAWCKVFNSRSRYPLLAEDEQFQMLVWPHPSPLNRWHNEPANTLLLESTFEIVRSIIENKR
jgi:uracil-DNA glycosylase family 4